MQSFNNNVNVQFVPQVMLKQVADNCYVGETTILDKSLGTLAHFCSICQGNLSVRPLPQFKVFYRDEVVIARFQHRQGGRGFLIPVMPFKLLFPK